FPLPNYMEFFFREFQLGKQTPSFISIQINDGDRFACRVTKLARNQQRCEMIARWHVPFARADKDSSLLIRWQTKIPSLIFNGIRRRNKCDAPAAPASVLIDFRGFRSCSDASIRLRHNFHEAR